MTAFEVIKKFFLPLVLALVITILALVVNDYEKKEVGTLSEVAGEETSFQISP